MAKSVSRRFIAFNDSDFRLHDEAAFNAGWDALLSEIGPLVADLRINEQWGQCTMTEMVNNDMAIKRLRELVREGK